MSGLQAEAVDGMADVESAIADEISNLGSEAEANEILDATMTINNHTTAGTLYTNAANIDKGLKQNAVRG